MTYVDHVYGNHIEFTDKQSKRKREQTLIRDKNQFVYFACIYRRRWGDIETFKDFRYNVAEGSWIITMSATPRMHDRVLTLLNDPKVMNRFFRRIEWWKKHYHRMAKRYAKNTDDRSTESETEAGTDGVGA